MSAAGSRRSRKEWLRCRQHRSIRTLQAPLKAQVEPQKNFSGSPLFRAASRNFHRHKARRLFIILATSQHRKSPSAFLQTTPSPASGPRGSRISFTARDGRSASRRKSRLKLRGECSRSQCRNCRSRRTPQRLISHSEPLGLSRSRSLISRSQAAPAPAPYRSRFRRQRSPDRFQNSSCPVAYAKQSRLLPPSSASPEFCPKTGVSSTVRHCDPPGTAHRLHGNGGRRKGTRPSRFYFGSERRSPDHSLRTPWGHDGRPRRAGTRR